MVESELKGKQLGNPPDQANGNIHIKGGPYYHTYFTWIPSVGDLIEFTSLEEGLSSNKDSKYRLKVVHVLHGLRDVTQKHPETLMRPERSHWVDVYAETVEFNFDEEW